MKVNIPREDDRTSPIPHAPRQVIPFASPGARRVPVEGGRERRPEAAPAAVEVLATGRARPWTRWGAGWERPDGSATPSPTVRARWGDRWIPSLAHVHADGAWFMDLQFRAGPRGMAPHGRRSMPVSEAMAIVNARLRAAGVQLDGEDIPREVLEEEGRVVRLPVSTAPAQPARPQAELQDVVRYQLAMFNATTAIRALDIDTLETLAAGRWLPLLPLEDVELPANVVQLSRGPRVGGL